MVLIIDNSKIPVIVDAGIRTPSQAAEVMEMGASAVLLNTAVAKSLDPINMAYAMAKGVEGGRILHIMQEVCLLTNMQNRVLLQQVFSYKNDY